MVLWALLGEGDPDIVDAGQPSLEPSQLAMIGLRDLDVVGGSVLEFRAAGPDAVERVEPLVWFPS